ncbi:hypothetical protein BRC93_15260 [Halobacteriales archaeon QS_5_70_15]|nr:MAG: hypothetical protein BRC93_15260 [Halobacteriales archaeon QS_5_70_15]
MELVARRTQIYAVVIFAMTAAQKAGVGIPRLTGMLIGAYLFTILFQQLARGGKILWRRARTGPAE